MMKAGLALLAIALCAQGAFASRTLQQLPTLGSSGSYSPAPAPGPLSGGACALGYLENAGDFTTLLDLIQAASEADLLKSILGSGTELATLFAPTDDGIQKTLARENVTPEDLLSDPDQLTSILQYHITPSQLSARDLQNGFSFNTLYEVNNVAQSVAIQGNGASATVAGSASSAPIVGQQAVCGFIIYPIDGLLLSNAQPSATPATTG